MTNHKMQIINKYNILSLHIHIIYISGEHKMVIYWNLLFRKLSISIIISSNILKLLRFTITYNKNIVFFNILVHC
jgi:hypothetical protein